MNFRLSLLVVLIAISTTFVRAQYLQVNDIPYADAAANYQTPSQKQMNIQLNNGYSIPQIGVGTWTLKGDTAINNVRLALEAGFRHIDTAQGYDNQEPSLTILPRTLL